MTNFIVTEGLGDINQLITLGYLSDSVITTTDTHDGFKHDGTFRKNPHKNKTYEASIDKQSIRKQVEKLFYGEEESAVPSEESLAPPSFPTEKAIEFLPYDPTPMKLYNAEFKYHELLMQRRAEKFRLEQEDDDESAFLLLH